MIEEDKAYMSDILAAFKVTKFKLSETSTRFKLIIKPDEAFDMNTLHRVQDLRDPVGIEIDVNNGIYLECMKTGCSRKRRRIHVEKFEGKVPKKYDVGKFNRAMREILSMQDICDFDTALDGDTLTITNLETISYPILRRIEGTGCSVKVDMLKSNLTLKL